MRNKIIILALFLVTGILLGAAFLLTKCNGEPDRTTHTSSSRFTSKEAKIEFLQRYLKTSSEIIDTEYYIDYHDNSGGGMSVPGPSDGNIIVALKVPKDSIKDWTSGFAETSEKEVSLKWWDILNLDKTEWKVESKPRFYKRPSAYLVVYEYEGIILKKVATI